MNKPRSNKRFTILPCGLLLVLLAVSIVQIGRAWRQAWLDRQLIVAVKQGKIQQAPRP